MPVNTRLVARKRAHNFRLTPGGGVHIPVNAPHWVKNDANVSVSLSVNFEWENELAYNVYRAKLLPKKAGSSAQPTGTFSPPRLHKKSTVMA